MGRGWGRGPRSPVSLPGFPRRKSKSVRLGEFKVPGFSSEVSSGRLSVTPLITTFVVLGTVEVGFPL